MNRPIEAIREQTTGLEHGLHRFFAACAAHPQACGFGDREPQEAFEDLIARLDTAPMPAPHAADPRPVDGDDLRFAVAYYMLSPNPWPRFAAALAHAQAGDGERLRDFADAAAYQRTRGGRLPHDGRQLGHAGERPALPAPGWAVPGGRPPRRQPVRAHGLQQRLRRDRDGAVAGGAGGHVPRPVPARGERHPGIDRRNDARHVHAVRVGAAPASRSGERAAVDHAR